MHIKAENHICRSSDACQSSLESALPRAAVELAFGIAINHDERLLCQVLMVIFDILASHHRMLLWHQQRIEEHQQDLEQLHQLKLESTADSLDLKTKVEQPTAVQPENGHSGGELLEAQPSEAVDFTTEISNR